jgi:uncharacterized protein YyaL (SSP411 family)
MAPMYDLSSTTSNDLVHFMNPSSGPNAAKGNYHKLHFRLMHYMYDITGNTLFKKLYDRWKTYTPTKLDTQVSKTEERIIDTSLCSQKEYKIYNQAISILDFNELPYNEGLKVPNKEKYYDDNLIPLHNYKGKLNYHPVVMAQHALHLLDVYNSTQNTKYLNLAKSISDKLISISLSIQSSIFFPYIFDFSLHGYKEDTMHSPWYSGLAQGQIISLFIRLYEITHEGYYLEVSKKIFNSFELSHHNDTGNPWVSCVDENAYLWLEEYPHTPPMHTLNGMVFAIFGIYDLYRITKDTKVEKVLRGAIITIKDNINKFRVPNGISHYCLRHPKIMSLFYHNIHISQLRMLYKITGDNFFLEASNNFFHDTQNMNKGK